MGDHSSDMPSLVKDWSDVGYATVLGMTDQSPDMPKSCEWLIGNTVLQMIDRSPDLPKSRK